MPFVKPVWITSPSEKLTVKIPYYHWMKWRVYIHDVEVASGRKVHVLIGQLHALAVIERMVGSTQIAAEIEGLLELLVRPSDEDLATFGRTLS